MDLVSYYPILSLASPPIRAGEEGMVDTSLSAAAAKIQANDEEKKVSPSHSLGEAPGAEPADAQSSGGRRQGIQISFFPARLDLSSLTLWCRCCLTGRGSGVGWQRHQDDVCGASGRLG